MNRCYKLIWNRAQRAWVVASELARSQQRSSPAILLLFASCLPASLVHAIPGANTLPAGEAVVVGSATFNRSTPNQLNITQTGSRLLTNWSSFDIGSAATVNFVQPNTASVALNRVSSGSPTEIYGKLNANGQVMLVNPSGLVFGSGSQINAQSVLASVLDIQNSDFNSGNYLFSRGSSTGSIDNNGSITASNGAVVMLAPSITNRGSLQSTAGYVGLINADQFNRNSSTAPALTQVSTVAGLIKNTGSLQADKVSSVSGKIILLGDTSQGSSGVDLSGQFKSGNGVSVSGRNIDVTSLSTDNHTVFNPTQLLKVNGTLDLNGLSSQLQINGAYSLAASGRVNLRGSSATLSIDGQAYSIIRDVNQLQAMSSNLAGRYALAGDIQAAATSSWNGGAGFASVGTDSTAFTGRLEGLGHSVNSLKINRPSSDYVGLIGYGKNSTLQNVGLKFASILGRHKVGGLMGVQLAENGSSMINNSYVAGVVNGQNMLGGLIGYGISRGANASLTLARSYSQAIVSQTDNAGSATYSAGGLIGNLWADGGLARVQQSYASEGSVQSNNSQVDVGGLIGSLNNGDGAYGGGGITLIANHADIPVSAASGYAGGLIGMLNNVDGSALVSGNYVTGTVTGSGAAGGIAGLSVGYGGAVSLDNNYATGAVTGQLHVGGLLGLNQGSSTVTASYASGKVQGNTNVGGLIGYNQGAAVSNSYWDTDSTAQPAAIGTSSGASSISNLNALSGNGGANPSAYAKASYANLDFNNLWFISNNNSRPMLRAMLNAPDRDGRIAIDNLYQLQGMSASPAASYYLGQDISAYATSISVDAGNMPQPDRSDVWGGRGFAPVGEAAQPFSGQLDGRDFVVSNLYIDRYQTDNVGLIGYASNSTIQNIGLLGVSIAGANNTAGLVAYQTTDAGNALINRSYATGFVMGTDFVGGLVGSLTSNQALTSVNRVRDSYSTAEVWGQHGAGGLVGFMGSSRTGASVIIENTYATGLVNGDQYVGGLVGRAFSSLPADSNVLLRNSYAAGRVAGYTDVGGLVGNASGAVINLQNSYWNTETSTRSNAVGMLSNGAQQSNLAGLVNSQIKQLASYGNWGSDIDAQYATGSAWRIYDGKTVPLLRAFLKPVTMTVQSSSKVYDGTNFSGGNGFSLSDPAAISRLYGSASYAGSAQGARNAGNYIIDIIGFYSIQSGYDLQVVPGTLTINKADLQIGSAPVFKTYDGTTAVVNGAAMALNSTFLRSGDSFSGGSFSYADKNAGTAKVVNVSGVTVNDGNSGNNYNISYIATPSGYIDKKMLTITPVADSKVYSGTLASAGVPTVSGRVRGDFVNNVTQAFTDKNVGTNKTLRVNGYSINDGNGGNNYMVISFDTSNGTITPRSLIISTVANTKVYDGGVTSANKPVTTGLVTGDSIAGLFQQYETKYVGTNKKMLIKAGYVVKDGNSGANYSVTEQSSNNGVITLP